jgi:cytosolic prostaglandin-E synthase
MTNSGALHPQVLWAQREDIVYLTIDLSDVRDELVNLTKDSLVFDAIAGSEGQKYTVQLDFHKSINPSVIHNNLL